MLCAARRLQSVACFSSVLVAGSLAIALPGVHARAQAAAHFSPGLVNVESNTQDPNGLFIDAANNVYIADQNNNRILKETRQPDGTFTQSVPISGIKAPEGLFVDSAGNIYIAANDSSQIIKETLSGGSYTASVLISGFRPTDVALDSAGNLYALDGSSGHVFKFMVNGTGGFGTATAIASGLSYGSHLRFNANGVLYVADEIAGSVITLTGSGTAYTQAVAFQISYASGVDFDSAGNVYIASSASGSTGGVYKETYTNGGYVRTQIYSSGNVTSDVKVDSLGDVFAVNFQAHTVELPAAQTSLNLGSVQTGGSGSSTQSATLSFDTGGQLGAISTRVAGVSTTEYTVTGGTCNTSTAYTAGQTCTIAVQFKPQVAGMRAGAILVQNSSGATIATLDLNGTGSGSQVNFYANQTPQTLNTVLSAQNVAVDDADDVFVLSSSNGVYRLDHTCVPNDPNCPQIAIAGARLAGVAIDGPGNLYTSTSGRVYKFIPGCASFACAVPITPVFLGIQDLAVDANGTVYVALYNSSFVLAVPAGCTVAGCEVQLGGGFSSPASVAVDAAGAVYVADSGTQTVSSIPAGCTSASCVVTLGTGFQNLAKVVPEPSGGVLVVDGTDSNVYRIPPGCATATCRQTINTHQLSANSAALDRYGNLFATSSSGSVQKVDLRDAPTVAFTSTPVGAVSTDSPASVVVSNIGNSALVISSGANPVLSTGFSVVSPTSCQLPGGGGTTLAAGSTCVYDFQFQPNSVANTSGKAVVSDSDLRTNATQTQTINFTGAVTPGAVSVSVPNVSVPLGTTTKLTATVTGPSAGVPPAGTVTIAVGNGAAQTASCMAGTGSSANSETCTITVTASGSATITAKFFNDANYTNMSGQGMLTATQTPSVANSSYTFSPALQDVGGSSALLLVVKDDSGNPIPSAKVTVQLLSSTATVVESYNNSSTSIPPGQPQPYGPVVTTDNNGRATLTLTASAPTTVTVFSITINSGYSSVTLTPGVGSVTFAQPSYVVTTLTDDATGVAANCPDLAVSPGATSNMCSLRDAITAANAEPAGAVATITFSQALLTGAPVTITEASSLPTIVSGMTITGLSGVPGQVAISGNNAYGIFTVNANGAGPVTLNSLTVTQANNPFGAINMQNGTLVVNGSALTRNSATFGAGLNVTGGNTTLTSCTVNGNASSVSGGGISSAGGTLTVLNSTVNGNSAPIFGGGINMGGGTLIVINSTVTGNSSTGQGGGLAITGGAVTLLGSTISGNSATVGNGILDAGGQLSVSNTLIPDAIVGYTLPAGQGNVTSGANLSPLGSYGGLTQTILPLPGSAAICAGVAGNIPSGVTTDQRGTANTQVYSGTTCVDSGAVQTHYTLAFGQQPSNVTVGGPMNPAPTVQVMENNLPYTVYMAPVTLSGAGIASGNSANTAPFTDIALFPALVFNTVETNDTLTANLGLNSAVTPAVFATPVASNPFDVTPAAPPVVTLNFNPATTYLHAGSYLVVTLTNPSSNTIRLSGVQVTVTVPGSLLASLNASTLGSSCTSVSATGNSPNVFQVTEASLPAHGSCVVMVPVTAYVAGSFTATTNAPTATNANAGTSASAPITVLTPSAANSTYTASAGRLEPGQTVNYVMTVRDTNGNPIPNAGVEISLDVTTAGTITLSGSSGGNMKQGNTQFTYGGQTDANGTFTVSAQLSDIGEAFSQPTFFVGTQTYVITEPNNGPPAYVRWVNPIYQVTTLADDAANGGAGTGSNCPDLNVNPTATSTNCSLRDAVAAANGQSTTATSSISFAPGLTSGATTANPAVSTLGGAQISLTGNMNITGPGANLLQISGNKASRVFLTSGTDTISGLTITNGAVAAMNSGAGLYVGGGSLTLTQVGVTNNTAALTGSATVGGGISVGDPNNRVSAALTLIGCTIAGNVAQLGGGLNLDGTSASILNTTFSGNTAGSGGGNTNGLGGGIYADQGALSMVGSTVAQNAAAVSGGGLVLYKSASISNTVVAGNSAPVAPDIQGGGAVSISGSGNYLGISVANPVLAALGYYGGSTQTLLPLPGSPAICAGVAGNIPSGTTTDQRGTADTQIYSGNTCVDAGAVQTHYAIAFTQQPSNVVQNAAMAPAPAVTVTENSLPLTAAGETIVLTQSGTGAVAGTSATTSTTSGAATYPALTFNTAQNGDTLTAPLTLNAATSTAISGISTTFNVTPAATQLAFGTAPPATITAGGTLGVNVTVKEEDANGNTVIASDTISLAVTGPSGYSETYTTQANNGVATFNTLHSVFTTAGTYTYTATSGTLTRVTATNVVTPGPASSISVVSGSGQSAAYNTAFAAPLVVAVTDQYGNAVGAGTAVTFTPPASGASATMTPTVAQTQANGTASATATANNQAGSYSVTASVSGAGTAASFTLTNNRATTSVTVMSAGTPYGTTSTSLQATLNGVVGSTSAAFTFQVDSGAVVPASCSAGPSPITCMASYNTATLMAGQPHTITATYAGDANYGSSSNTGTLTVTPAPLAITANNTTRYYGAANPAFTGTVTGTKNNDALTESFTTAAMVTSAPGPYAIVPAVSGANVTDYNVTATSGTLVITQAPTITSLATSAPTINPNQSVMLYVTVASTTSGTPTGSATFYDNGTALMTVSLTNGSASYSTSLSPGVAHALTASYSGDTNFLGSSSSNSSPVTVGALDFTFTDTANPAATVAPGHTASFSFGLSPNFGSYAGPVTFSVTGLPLGATASFTPSSVAANGGAQTVVLNIVTPAPIAATHTPASPFDHRAPLLALLLLPAFGSRKLRKALRARLLLAVLFLGGLSLAASLTGCATGTGFELQQPATYTMTVTASSGALVHTQTVTLTIQ